MVIDYLEIAQRAVEREQGQAKSNPQAVGSNSTGQPQAIRAADQIRPPSECMSAQVWLSWAEWKAGSLNRLFLEQGATGQLGRITPETILLAERITLTDAKPGAGKAI